MLAVVRQKAVAALAQARACACHDLAASEARRIVAHSDVVTESETLERNLLHRSAPPSVSEAGVMNDAAIADVDAVVTVEGAWRDEMRGKWRLLADPQERVACAVCMVNAPVHDGKIVGALAISGDCTFVLIDALVCARREATITSSARERTRIFSMTLPR